MIARRTFLTCAAALFAAPAVVKADALMVLRGAPLYPRGFWIGLRDILGNTIARVPVTVRPGLGAGFQLTAHPVAQPFIIHGVSVGHDADETLIHRTLGTPLVTGEQLRLTTRFYNTDSVPANQAVRRVYVALASVPRIYVRMGSDYGEYAAPHFVGMIDARHGSRYTE